MPQHTQHSLVYILLMWTTLNTIIQVIFITLFFTVGRNELSLNSSTHSSTIEPKHNTQSQSPSHGGLILGEGKMITFKATDAKSVVTWVAKNPNTYVISDSGKDLQILKDGHYFLNLRVTLEANRGVNSSEHTVKLMWDNNEVVLEGWINTITKSTGVLSKVQNLSAGKRLTVRIEPPSSYVDTTESVTHLDIIFMNKP
ncbi:uncharacterized protein LOC121653070 isoform X2 [Melanotaenia boesemani]|nr:uncharacterized protein LOC121653070 isoform X2 [Melanotaenia boesemani]